MTPACHKGIGSSVMNGTARGLGAVHYRSSKESRDVGKIRNVDTK